MIWSLLNRGCIAYLFYYFIINTYLHSDNWLGASFRTYVLQSNSVGRGGRGRPHNRTQGTKYKHQRAGSSHLRQDNHLFVQAMFMFYSRCTGCLLVLSFSLSPPLFYRKSSPSLFSPPRSSLSLSLSSSSENSLLLSISASVCTCADLTPPSKSQAFVLLVLVTQVGESTGTVSSTFCSSQYCLPLFPPRLRVSPNELRLM